MRWRKKWTENQKLTFYYVRVKQAIKHHEMEVTCHCTIFTTFVIVGEMWLVIQIHIYGAIRTKCACIFALYVVHGVINNRIQQQHPHCQITNEHTREWKSACDCGGGAENRITIMLYICSTLTHITHSLISYAATHYHDYKTNNVNVNDVRPLFFLFYFFDWLLFFFIYAGTWTNTNVISMTLAEVYGSNRPQKF